VSTILIQAQRAYDTVDLYRWLYRSRPSSEYDVPFVSHVHFHRTRNVLNCVAGGCEILGAVPNVYQGLASLPLTPIESGEEWDLRLDRLVSALTHLGLPVSDKRYRFLIVAERETGVFASYLSDQLAWLRQQASIAYMDFSGFDAVQTFSAHVPDVVLSIAPLTECLKAALDESEARVVTFEHIGKPYQYHVAYDRLLVCDELHAIAASRAGADRYYYDESAIVVEREPHSGHLAVTLPTFTCWPWVRYLVGGTVGPDSLIAADGV
jgi:hypothetical protein